MEEHLRVDNLIKTTLAEVLHNQKINRQRFKLNIE